MILQTPDTLALYLGNTAQQKIQTLTEIKNAMAAAIFSLVENDCATKCNPLFAVYQQLYYEADYLLHLQSNQ